MQCESCSEPIEVQSVVRSHNRALRRIVRYLRQNLHRKHEIADEMFKSLCEVNVEAENELRRLWKEGGFQPPCGPEDYQEIVDTSIRALRAYRDAAVTPAQSVDAS